MKLGSVKMRWGTACGATRMENKNRTAELESTRKQALGLLRYLPQAPWIQLQRSTFAKKQLPKRTSQHVGTPANTSRDCDGLALEAATFAVGIDAPVEFATVLPARLLLLSFQYNNFVHLLLRLMCSCDTPAMTVAGYRNFRDQIRSTHLRTEKMFCAWLLIALAAVSMWFPASAHAAGLPFRAAISLGEPGVRAEIRVEIEQDDTRITVRTPRGTAQTTVRATWTEVDLESVTLASGDVVGVLRATGSSGRAAALVVASGGRPSIPWVGRLDMHGDPGERTADWLDLSDRTGDGHPDLVIAQIREGVGLCGESPALLYPRALDPATHEFRPVVLRRVPTDGEEIAIEATSTSPGPTEPPIVRALMAVGASSEVGIGEQAAQLRPPRALVDGNHETYWAEGRGGPGEGEFVQFRFGAGMPIRAIAISTPSDAATSAPESLVLIGDRGPRLRVTIPRDGVGRVWIVPPTPLEWSCFSLVLVDAQGAPSVRTAIAEVEVYTRVDFEGGIDALVRELVRDGDAGDRAAELLSRLGSAALPSLESAWDRLGVRGRERALRVVTGPARAGESIALRIPALAANDDAEAVRERALSILGSAGAAGRTLAVEIAAGDGAGAEDAANFLVGSEEAFDFDPLLAAISRDGGSERPALRAALCRAIALSAPESAETILHWQTEAPIAARASLALGLVREPRAVSIATRIIDDSIEEARDFADRFRMVRAAMSLETTTSSIDDWLAELAISAEEWMLRATAIEALGTRRPEVTQRAMRDPYPRVRAVAAGRISNPSEPTVRALASEDPWPLVRIAALDALAQDGQARPSLEIAITDPAPSVRRRAIEHATRLDIRVPALRERLDDPREHPRVLESALEHVEHVCDFDAGPSLLGLIRRGIRPDARQSEIEIAVRALRVATRLGGPLAEDARTIAARGGEVMQAAIQAARNDEVRCQDPRS